jgi:hypothetical protein
MDPEPNEGALVSRRPAGWAFRSPRTWRRARGAVFVRDFGNRFVGVAKTPGRVVEIGSGRFGVRGDADAPVFVENEG